MEGLIFSWFFSVFAIFAAGLIIALMAIGFGIRFIQALIKLSKLYV